MKHVPHSRRYPRARLNVSLDPAEAARLQTAARLRGQRPTAFLADAGLQETRRVLQAHGLDPDAPPDGEAVAA